MRVLREKCLKKQLSPSPDDPRTTTGEAVVLEYFHLEKENKMERRKFVNAAAIFGSAAVLQACMPEACLVLVEFQ